MHTLVLVQCAALVLLEVRATRSLLEYLLADDRAMAQLVTDAQTRLQHRRDEQREAEATALAILRNKLRSFNDPNSPCCSIPSQQELDLYHMLEKAAAARGESTPAGATLLPRAEPPRPPQASVTPQLEGAACVRATAVPSASGALVSDQSPAASAVAGALPATPSRGSSVPWVDRGQHGSDGLECDRLGPSYNMGQQTSTSRYSSGVHAPAPAADRWGSSATYRTLQPQATGQDPPSGPAAVVLAADSSASAAEAVNTNAIISNASAVLARTKHVKELLWAISSVNAWHCE